MIPAPTPLGPLERLHMLTNHENEVVADCAKKALLSAVDRHKNKITHEQWCHRLFEIKADPRLNSLGHIQKVRVQLYTALTDAARQLT